MQRRNTPRPQGPGFAGSKAGKARTPWGTIFLTAVVAGAGTYTAMQLMLAAQKKTQERARANDSRDLLLNPAPVSTGVAAAAISTGRTVTISEELLAQITSSVR